MAKSDKDKLQEEVITQLELALDAVTKGWPVTAQMHISNAEIARHKWDALLMSEHAKEMEL